METLETFSRKLIVGVQLFVSGGQAREGLRGLRGEGFANGSPKLQLCDFDARPFGVYLEQAVAAAAAEGGGSGVKRKREA